MTYERFWPSGRALFLQSSRDPVGWRAYCEQFRRSTIVVLATPWFCVQACYTRPR